MKISVIDNTAKNAYNIFMDNLIHEIRSLLIKNKKTLSVAESCTGGLLSKLLTDLPSSSRYFLMGIVTYSNNSKEKILGIPKKLISKKGAVSKQVAEKMARSIRRLSGSNIAIAITGIAGPGGGSLKKPTGTVFIAVEANKKTISRKFVFSGNRQKIRKDAAIKGLRILKKLLI